MFKVFMGKSRRRLVAVTMSLALITMLLPATALGNMPENPGEGGQEATELLSSAENKQGRTNDISIVSGKVYGTYTLSAGEEITFRFKVDDLTLSGFSITQSSSMSNGSSLQATVSDANNNAKYEWGITCRATTCSFGPFALDPGEYSIRLKANTDVSRIGIKLSNTPVDYEATAEREPNSDPNAALAIETGKAYVGTIYDPANEFYVQNQFVGIADTDYYKFTLDKPANVNILLNTQASVVYDLKLTTSGRSIVNGTTKSGAGNTQIKCGQLEAGTYYLSFSGTDTAWLKPYIFTIGAKETKITRIELSQTEYEYNGSYCRPTFSVWAGDTLVEDDLEPGDYSSKVSITGDRYTKNAGTYTITVAGKGDYSGTAEATYTIKPRPITRIVLGTTRYDYYSSNPIAWYPYIMVYCGLDKIETIFDSAPEKENFIAEYPENPVLPGTYEVTVRAFGNYSGTFKASYSIVDPYAPIVTPEPSDPGTSDPEPSNPDIPDPGIADSNQVMYRLYNPNSGEHFYTASTVERDHLDSVGWNYEGIGWTAPQTSDTPVYRLYSGTDHHYTTSAYERDELVNAGWSYEGIGWYSDDAQGVPLYRQFNPYVNPWAFRNNSGSHNYTTSIDEHWNLVGIGWIDEGVGWYGLAL